LGKEDEIETTRARLADAGRRRCRCFTAPTCWSPEDIADLVKTTEEKFGSVDVIVPNAGIQHVEKIEAFRSANGTRSWQSTCRPHFT
jgi:3-hydroxybutyrate dehydrogenase